MGAWDSLIAALVLTAGTGALASASWRAAGWLVGSDLLDRAFAALLLALAGLCLVMQSLGILGLLYRWPVTLVLIGLAAVVLSRRGRPAERQARARPGFEELTAVALATVLAVLAIVLGLQGITASPDTLQYHAVNAGTWLQAHSILELPPADPGFATNAYPSDHTLTGLWLMLPTGSDELSYVINVLWGALVVLGGAMLTRTLGGRAAGGAMLTLGVLMTPLVFNSQANSMLSDLAATGGIVAGTVAGLRALRAPRDWPWALLCGLAVGLAAGSKVTAFVPGAAILAMIMIARDGRWRRTGIALAAAGSLIGFWLIRNAVEFGNPLFPLDLGLLRGHQSPLTVFETPIASHILDANRTIVSRWLELVRDSYGLAFLLPFAAILAGAVAWWHGRRELALAGAVTFVALAAYFVTPYTGGGPDGTLFLIGSQLRYAIPAVCLGAALVAAAAPRWVPVIAAALVLFGAYRLAEVDESPRPDVDITAARVLLAAAAAVVVTVVWAKRPRVNAAASLGIAAAGLLTVALFLHAKDPQPPTLTEKLLANCSGGRVGVVQFRELRVLMGRRFDVPLVMVDRAAPAGRTPILDPAELDRRIAELRPDLIAHAPGPLQAAGWDGPPGWRVVARYGPAYLSAPPNGCVR